MRDSLEEFGLHNEGLAEAYPSITSLRQSVPPAVADGTDFVSLVSKSHYRIHLCRASRWDVAGQRSNSSENGGNCCKRHRVTGAHSVEQRLHQGSKSQCRHQTPTPPHHP